MPGTWTTTRVSPWAIHTFTAPEDGWLVNSHIIELPSTAVRYRRAVHTTARAGSCGLRRPPGKPLTRLYVTHYHPDHLLGAAAKFFGKDQLRDVEEEIIAAKTRAAREREQVQA
jgi:glyoxylase-like metal-dependent hydrolase (beta-lactamase superfamily II)